MKFKRGALRSGGFLIFGAYLFMASAAFAHCDVPADLAMALKQDLLSKFRVSNIYFAPPPPNLPADRLRKGQAVSVVPMTAASPILRSGWSGQAPDQHLIDKFFSRNPASAGQCLDRLLHITEEEVDRPKVATVYVSIPVFSESGTAALFLVNRNDHGHAAQTFLYFEKRSHRWAAVGNLALFVS